MRCRPIHQFFECHTGAINLMLHGLGLFVFFVGIFEKNLLAVIAGGALQEFGHAYQCMRTGNPEHSPWYCAKTQFFIAHLLWALAVLYVLLPL